MKHRSRFDWAVTFWSVALVLVVVLVVLVLLMIVWWLLLVLSGWVS